MHRQITSLGSVNSQHKLIVHNIKNDFAYFLDEINKISEFFSAYTAQSSVSPRLREKP